MRTVSGLKKERRLRSDVYSDNGEMKRCNGKMHEEPVMLPLVRFHIHKSGPNAGKPFSECIECWRARRGHDPKLARIPKAEWLPVVTRLVSILGSKSALSELTGKYKGFYSRQRDKMDARVFRELEELLSELEGRRSGHGEAEVLEDKNLFAAILNNFMEEWRRERPPDDVVANGHFAQDKQHNFIGVLEWLSSKTGIHERRIREFQHGKVERVPLSQADALIQAMNLTHLFWNGTLKVIPNPLWSLQKYLDYMRERGCV